MAPDHDRTDHALSPDTSFAGESTTHDQAPVASPETAAVGTRVGPYIIVDTIGAGAMGVVYAALDPRLDRKVAIKMVRSNPGEASKGAPRLLREAQALAQLSHPNVVPVFDVGQHAEGVFLAMELVHGEDFRHWLMRRPQPWREIVAVLIDAGRGLAAAHAAGIVHRDFKPDNVLLDASGRARVTDFGLARGHGEIDAPLSVALDNPDTLSATLTRTGSVVGTPSYMAPEQHTGKPVDGRADQYAFCVTLYESLYGERPFVGRDLQDLANHKWTETFASDVSMLMRRGMPEALHAVIVRGLKQKPAERFADMNALISALETAVARKRKWSGLVIGIGAAAATVGGVLWLARPDSCPDARGQLAGIWDAERRDRVALAFEGSKTAAATDVLAEVERTLDGFASTWVDAHAQICTAALAQHRGDPELDAGMLCLQQRLARLGGVVEVLEEGSRASVHSADAMLATLDDPHACRDAVARVEPAQVTRDRQPLREALDVADVRLGAAQYGTAREIAAGVERGARAVGITDLELEAQLTIAIADVKSGRYAAAQTSFESVFWGAQAAGLDEIALRAATRMVFLLGELVERPDEGFTWLRHAQSELDRLGEGETLARAKLLENAASLYDGALQEERAETMLRDALAIRLRLQPEDHAAVSMVRNNLALRLADRGSHDEALALLQLTHRNRIQRLGPSHPDVAMSLINEARVLTELSRGAEALERLDDAEPIVRGAHGDAHPMLDVIQLSRGAALMDIDQLDAARAYLQLALSSKILSVGHDSPSVGHLWNAIAVTYMIQKDPPRARMFFQRALDVFAGLGDSGDHGRAYVLSNRATLELLDGKLDDAKRMIAESVAIFERIRPRGHPDVALALSNRAQVEMARGELEAAAKSLDRVAALGVAGLVGKGRPSVVASMRARLGWLRDGVPEDADAQLVAFRAEIAKHDVRAIELEIIDRWRERLARGEPVVGPDGLGL